MRTPCRALFFGAVLLHGDLQDKMDKDKKKLEAARLASEHHQALGMTEQELSAKLSVAGTGKMRSFPLKSGAGSMEFLLCTDGTFLVTQKLKAAADREEIPTPAKIILGEAKKLIEVLQKRNVRFKGDRFFEVSPKTGIVEEYDEGLEKLKKIAKAVSAGSLTPSDAAIALDLALALLEEKEEYSNFRLDPKKIMPLLGPESPAGTPCWERLDLDLTKPIENRPPRYAEYVSRLPSEAQLHSMEVFLGSLLDPYSDRTQYLYIWAEGGDGKSTFMEMLRGVLKRAMYVTRGETYKQQYGKVAVEGKRLILLQEEGRSGFLSSPEFKELTGDGAIEVQRKYHDNYMIEVQAKVIVVSNYAPLLSGGRADLRRIIPVRLKQLEHGDKIDLAFKEELLAEGPDVLRFCYGKYLEWRKANPNGGKLGDPEELAKVEKLTAEAQARTFVHAVFEKSEGRYITMEAFNNQVKLFAPNNMFLANRAKEVFERDFQVQPGDVGKGMYGYANVWISSRRV